MPSVRFGLASFLLLLLVFLSGTTVADSPVRQVLIESRIVIANNDFMRDIGVEWGHKFLDEDALDSVDRCNEYARTGTQNIMDWIEQDPVYSQSQAGSNALGALGLAIAQNDAIAELLSRAADKSVRGKVISKPSLIARNAAFVATGSLLGRDEERFRSGKRGQKDVSRLYNSVANLSPFYEAFGLPNLLEGFVETWSGGSKKRIQNSLYLTPKEKTRAKVRRRALELSTSSRDPAVAFVKTNLLLHVTPTIDSDYSILLDISVNAKTDKQMARYDGATTALEVSTDAGTDDERFAFLGVQYTKDGAEQLYVANEDGEQAVMPLILPTREAITAFIVKDGATMVIGGLIRETNEVLSAEIPALSKIPTIGWGMRDAERRGKSRYDNLVIFVTPHIIREQ